MKENVAGAPHASPGTREGRPAPGQHRGPAHGQQRGPARQSTRAARHAAVIGIAASLLVHVVLALWNPIVHRLSSTGRAPDPTTRAVTWRAAALHPPPSGAAVAPAEPVAAAQPAPRAEPETPRRVGPAARGDESPAPPPGLAERFGYRPGAAWAPLPGVYESVEECRQREYAERLDSVIVATRASADSAARQPGPGSGGSAPSAGIRIPFGRKPPPPAQVVAAPLPDTMQRMSQRVPDPPPRLRRARGCLDSIPSVTPRLGPRQ